MQKKREIFRNCEKNSIRTISDVLFELAFSFSYRQFLQFSDGCSPRKIIEKLLSVKIFFQFGVNPGFFINRSVIAKDWKWFWKTKENCWRFRHWKTNEAVRNWGGMLPQKTSSFLVVALVFSLAIESSSFSFMNSLREKSIWSFEEGHKTSFSSKSKLWCFIKIALAQPDFVKTSKQRYSGYWKRNAIFSHSWKKNSEKKQLQIYRWNSQFLLAIDNFSISVMSSSRKKIIKNPELPKNLPIGVNPGFFIIIYLIAKG